MQPGLAAAHQWFSRACPKTLAGEMAELGAKFAEFGSDLPELESHPEWLYACRESGLTIFFHLPYQKIYNLKYFRQPESREALLNLFEFYHQTALKQNAECRVNLHSAQGNAEDDLGKLYQLTQEALRWIYRQRTEKGWNLEFSVELLPFNPEKKRVGDNIPSLLLLKEILPDLKLNFCLDLGHYHLNYLLGKDGELPRDFLKQVTHVHFHDICRGVDHYPVSCREVPFEAYLSLLPNNHTTIGLEIHHEFAVLKGEPFSGLKRSLVELTGLIAKLDGKGY